MRKNIQNSKLFFNNLEITSNKAGTSCTKAYKRYLQIELAYVFCAAVLSKDLEQVLKLQRSSNFVFKK